MAKIKVTKFNGTEKELNKIRNGVKDIMGLLGNAESSELETLNKIKPLETFWIDTDYIFAVGDIIEGVGDYPSRYLVYLSPDVENNKNIWNITADSYEELMKVWKK